MDLKKFNEEAKKVKMSEMGIYLLKRLASMINELENRIVDLHSGKKSGRITTTGGSSIEEISLKGIKPDTVCIAQIEEEGAAPVTIKTCKCQLDKIVIEFSGDPSTDHKVIYFICN